MNINKRGDHLFAAGLWKAIGDVAKSVRTQVGQYSEGRVLANALLEFQRDLGGSEFDVTINQGRVVTGADAHSLVFGQAVRRFRQDMEALVFALQYRRGIDERDPGLRTEALLQANSQLATATCSGRSSTANRMHARGPGRRGRSRRRGSGSRTCATGSSESSRRCDAAGRPARRGGVTRSASPEPAPVAADGGADTAANGRDTVEPVRDATTGLRGADQGAAQAVPAYCGPIFLISTSSSAASASVRSTSGARTGPASWPTSFAPAFTMLTA